MSAPFHVFSGANDFLVAAQVSEVLSSFMPRELLTMINDYSASTALVVIGGLMSADELAETVEALEPFAADPAYSAQWRVITKLSLPRMGFGAVTIGVLALLLCSILLTSQISID